MNFDFTARGVATLLFRYMKIIVGITATFLILALIYFFTATNIYQAQASLVLRFGSDIRPELAVDDRQIVVPSGKDERREMIENYLRIVQSREYAERLVKEFGVQTLYPKIYANPPRIGTAEDAATEVLRDSISAKSGTATNVVEISIFHPSRELGEKLLQRLIDMSVTTQADLYENPQLAFTASQTKAAQDLLEEKQAALNAKRRQSGIFEYDKQFELLLSQQSSASDNIYALNARTAEAEGRQQKLEAILGTVPTNVASIVDAAKYKEIQDLGNELSQLRAASTPAAKAALADKERQYQQRLREIQSLNRGGSTDIYQSLLADYLRSSADAEAARKSMEYWAGERRALSTRIENMQRDNQAIVDLTREVDLADASYRVLARKNSDASVNQRLNDEGITRISVIDAPYSDQKPARPRKFLLLAAALIGSLLLSGTIIVLREALSDRIASPHEIEQGLRLKVIAAYPKFDPRPAT
jgi:uncharacterized protein involved in exopolysaccharide biosynthesis